MYIRTDNLNIFFMKKRFGLLNGMNLLFLVGMSVGFISCEQDMVLLDDLDLVPDASIKSRSILFTDSISLFSNIENFSELNMKKNSINSEFDEYYSSNMWAIRELPFALKVC